MVILENLYMNFRLFFSSLNIYYVNFALEKYFKLIYNGVVFNLMEGLIFMLLLNFADIVLSVLTLINLAGFIYLENARFKSEQKLNDTSIYNKKFKLFCLVFWFIILTMFIIRYHFILLFIYFICFVFYLIKIFKNIHNSPSLSLSENDETFYLASSGFYISFFVVFDFADFLNLSSGLSSTVEIILFLVYFLLKIIIVFYLLMLNFVMLIHIINFIFSYKNIKINLKLNLEKKTYYLISMKFTLNWFTKVLYFLFAPLLYAIDILNIIWIKLKRRILNLLKKFFDFALKIYYNRNKYIVNILLISIIFSFVVTYFLIITNQEMIGNNIKDAYEFISTVIIIPLAFDLISRINSKSKNS